MQLFLHSASSRPVNRSDRLVYERQILSSFSALTRLVGSFDPEKPVTRKNPSPIWPIMCLMGR